MEGPLENIPEPLRALDILENVSDAVFALDRDWHFVYANGSALAMSRLPKERLIGGDLWLLFPEITGGTEEANLRQTMSEGAHRRFEYFSARQNFWMELDAYPTPGGLALFVRDITHRKRKDVDRDELYAALKAEQEHLRLSEERFRIALKNSPIAVFNQDADLRYTWIYNTAEEYRNIDWIGKSDLDLGEPIAHIVDMKRAVLRTGKGIRREVAVPAEGEPHYFDFHLEPLRAEDGSVVGLTGAATDISEQKRALAEIERQKTQLRSVIDGMPGLVSYVDRDLTYRFVNARYPEWLGHPVEYFEGRRLGEVLWPDAMPELRPHLERAFAGESVSFERRLQCIDAVRDVRATYVPQHSANGEIEGVIALILDITEQKRAEEARWESESQFRRIVELASEGIWVVDRAGCTTFANRRLAELMGRSPEEILGRHFREFIHPDDLTRGSEGFARRIQGDSSPREYRFVRKDGSVIWLDFTATPIRDNNGALTGVLAMCTDTTDRKLAQEQMQQTQKLESLGVLAGGIAHDFNNLLVGILGNASLAADIMGPSSPVQALLSGVVSAGERAARLTRQLLAYAGRDTHRTGPVDMDTLVSEILSLLHASVPRTVELKLNPAGNLPIVEGDEAQLQQIVMNLVINGAEAIPAGSPGTVTIATEAREPTAAEKQRAVIPFEQPEGPAFRCVMLSVGDSGSGMDAATAARIFDPFFTTKFAGRGLGLSAVLGIIKAHSGTLVIETAPGQGTTFRVFLRATSKAPEPAKPPPSPVSRGAGTILVVDDELPVRLLAVQALERAGFKVMVCCDGAEAIEAVEKHREIDAVLLDLAMPQMPGDKAAPEIRRLRPDIYILLSSGCGEREARERFKGIGVDGFLQKPYTVKGLVTELAEAMASRR